MNTVIPPITDPLGRHWQQPPLDRIVVDEHHAVMTRDTLVGLLDYSSTIPTGAYEGKMWRRHEGGKWLLCWFDVHADPSKLSIKFREILIA